MKTPEEIKERIKGLEELKEEFVKDFDNAKTTEEELSIRGNIVETLMKISVLKWVLK